MQNLTTFRELLIEAIGSSTKQDFANRAGMLPQQLSRYLKEGNKTKPSSSTLKKIADASGDETLYDKLLKACGYEETTATLRKSKPFDERALLNARDIKDGMTELTKGIGIYSSIEEFIGTYEMLFSTEDITVAYVYGKNEHFGPKFPMAEFSTCVAVKFETPLMECYTWLALYFVETRGGKIVVIGTATDPTSIYEAGGMKKETLEQYKGKDFVYVTKAKKGLDTKEKIINAVFRDFGEEYPYTYVGFGFYLKEDPKDIKGFLKRHKESFSTSDEDSALCDKAITEDPIEVFSEYDDQTSLGKGYPAAIAKIMREETGLPFYFYDEDKEHFPDNIPCIMIEGAVDTHGNYSSEYLAEDLIETCRPYAIELGISEIGEVHTQLMNYVHNNNIYEV